MNTCSVTATADQGARQTIRRIARDESRRPGRRDRLLRDAAPRRGREPARTSCASCRTREKDDLVRRRSATRARLTTAERFGDGDGPCGATLAPGVAGRTALTLARADRMRRALQLLHHSADPRRRPLAAARRRRRATIRRAVAAGYKEIAITGVHLGSYGRDLADGSSLDRARCDGWPTGRTTCCSASARSSRWTAPRDRRAGGGLAAARAALPSAAAARLGRHACAPCGGPTRRRTTERSSTRIRALMPARVDRLRHHRRLSGRDRRALRRDARAARRDCR